MFEPTSTTSAVISNLDSTSANPNVCAWASAKNLTLTNSFTLSAVCPDITPNDKYRPFSQKTRKITLQTEHFISLVSNAMVISTKTHPRLL